jgi:putative membrane protein
MSGWAVLGGISTLLFWVVLISFIVWIVLRLSDRGHGHGRGPEKQDPLEIAKMRYARGAITKEEFDQIKRDLLAP